MTVAVPTPVLQPNQAKDILQILLQGWADQSNTGEDHLDKTFLPYVQDHDQALASMLSLFSHWTNDLLSHAAGLGITIEMNTTTGLWYVAAVPPKPAEGHFYWKIGQQVWDASIKGYKYCPGSWEPAEPPYKKGE